MMPDLQVLYEDNHLLAVNKPAGLPTMGVPAGTPTLLALARQYVKAKYQKPGNVYLGVMSRLDAPVTGVLLLARTSKAARRLTEQFRAHANEKVYWALVEGVVEEAAGDLIDWLQQDNHHRRMHIVGPNLAGAKQARLSYRRLSTHRCGEVRIGFARARRGIRRLPIGQSATQAFSLLEVELRTGRKHQIRLQLAHAGHPVVGDRKYGSQYQFPVGIALHSRRLVLTHPVRGESLALEAPLPDAWTRFGVRVS
jgi:23S rRNA pseudouridine1911/1915/1917 synthase